MIGSVDRLAGDEKAGRDGWLGRFWLGTCLRRFHLRLALRRFHLLDATGGLAAAGSGGHQRRPDLLEARHAFLLRPSGDAGGDARPPLILVEGVRIPLEAVLEGLVLGRRPVRGVRGRHACFAC